MTYCNEFILTYIYTYIYTITPLQQICDVSVHGSGLATTKRHHIGLAHGTIIAQCISQNMQLYIE